MRTQINNTLLFGALIISAITSISSAQPISPLPKPDFKTARFGFKASPNFNWVKVMEGRMENNGTSLGFSYGIMADFNIGGNASYWLGTELNITSFPGKIASLDTLYNTAIQSPNAVAFTNVDFEYKLQYVQIPLTLKLKTNEIGNMIYWGQFGISPSVLIQNKVTTNSKEQLYKAGTSSHSPNNNNNDPLDFDGIVSGNETTGKVIDDVSPIRAGLVLGAGVEFKISGNTSAILGLRFDNGFTDLFRDGATKGRNNYLGIQTGIFF
jgi:opacity protein-like surface antigen